MAARLTPPVTTVSATAIPTPTTNPGVGLIFATRLCMAVAE
jgi:hypothetical protein